LSVLTDVPVSVANLASTATNLAARSSNLM